MRFWGCGMTSWLPVSEIHWDGPLAFWNTQWLIMPLPFALWPLFSSNSKDNYVNEATSAASPHSPLSLSSQKFGLPALPGFSSDGRNQSPELRGSDNWARPRTSLISTPPWKWLHLYQRLVNRKEITACAFAMTSKSIFVFYHSLTNPNVPNLERKAFMWENRSKGDFGRWEPKQSQVVLLLNLQG